MRPFVVSFVFLVVPTLLESIPVEEDLTISGKEKRALDQFKPKVIPYLPMEFMRRDIYLIKWLRAANLNLQTAKDNLFSNLRWREINGMDHILRQDFSQLEAEFPASTDGSDFEGRPVAAIDASQWDVRKALVSGKKDSLERYGYRLLEKGSQRVYEAQVRGEKVTQTITIINLQGFNLIQHACLQCIPFYIKFVLAFEHHYPGLAHKIIFINTPATFELVLGAVRPVMSRETKQALTIFGNKKGEWMKYILSIIPADQLDRQFGGNRID